MHFLYPQFLFALSALAIPVIIHLFNFRRYKKIFFTNVRFLSHIQKEHRSRNKLRNLLLLLLRLLALGSIIVAFAQPYIPHKNTQFRPGRKYVYIYLDNSFSMSNRSSEGDLLQVAKKKAEEIAKAYSDADAFQLASNDFEIRQQHWVNKAELLTMLGEIQISPASRKLSEIQTRMLESFRETNNNRLAYYISDFQKNSSNFNALKPDTGIQLSLIPLEAIKQNNIYIDSAWFDVPIWQPGQTNTLFSHIVNASDQGLDDGTITLSINGKQKSLTSFSIPARSDKVVKLVYTISEPGTNECTLGIEDYPITFDNTLYFNYNVTSNLPVLIINGNGTNANINAAFTREKTFTVTNASQNNIDVNSLAHYSFIILNELPTLSSGLASSLQDFLTHKGSVLIIPPSQNITYESYSRFLSAVNANSFADISNSKLGVGEIDANNPFFSKMFEGRIAGNISMPNATRHYILYQKSSSNTIKLLQFVNGDALLSMTPSGKGFLYTLSTPLTDNWTNLSNHSLFLPLLYKMSFYQNQTDRIYFTIDQDNYLQVPIGPQNKEGIIRLFKGQSDYTPPQKIFQGKLSLFVEGLIKEAGFYSIAYGPVKSNSQPEGNEKPSTIFAFNYNRQESQMNFLSQKDILEESAKLHPQVLNTTNVPVTKAILAEKQGNQLWKWLILAGLIFILAETVVIRFTK